MGVTNIILLPTKNYLYRKAYLLIGRDILR